MNHHQHHPVPPSANSRGVIHDIIALRAYDLWQRAGQPENQADAHWLEAEQEQVAGRRKIDPVLPVSF